MGKPHCRKIFECLRCSRQLEIPRFFSLVQIKRGNFQLVLTELVFNLPLLVLSLDSLKSFQFHFLCTNIFNDIRFLIFLTESVIWCVVSEELSSAWGGWVAMEVGMRSEKNGNGRRKKGSRALENNRDNSLSLMFIYFYQIPHSAFQHGKGFVVELSQSTRLCSE